MEKLLEFYTTSKNVQKITELLKEKNCRIHLAGLSGSLDAVVAASVIQKSNDRTHVFILEDKESASYFTNDLESLFHEEDKDIAEKQVLLFPASFEKNNIYDLKPANLLQRTEVLNRLSAKTPCVVITYPEAIAERVASQAALAQNTFKIHVDEVVSDDTVFDFLSEYGFEYVDFVTDPGQYTMRGGIMDVFSYANDLPFRIEFSGDKVESLRTFDITTQLSVKKLDEIVITSNLKGENVEDQSQVSLAEYFPVETVVWFRDVIMFADRIEKYKLKAEDVFSRTETTSATFPANLFINYKDFLESINTYPIVEFGSNPFFKSSEPVLFESLPQPVFNKKFEFLISEIETYAEQNYLNYICIENKKQAQRIEKIFTELIPKDKYHDVALYQILELSLSKGFIDKNEKILCFTDHEIFERYHKYRVKEYIKNKEALSIKELFELKPGDYITHIDYGVGRFSGLEKIDNNGKIQESVRIIYKNNDVLYVSIHSLHKISRYIGKEGAEPTLNRLGSNTWQVLKTKTKQRLKDIAKDLIQLYAKRLSTKGFAFSPDSYLQDELEASFIYEDTPDQYKSTQDVKKDMESEAPMDRLVCGDVGFGKTEIAIRAAFKAVADSKQVSVLVPTTILAFQHYNTFKERLKGLPCRVDYISRFRTAKEKTQILKDLKEGKIDILIGTHAITGKNIEFKDLGLLIIDEEQKFGVSVKEKLRQMKVEVDSLTLTATPIPRTLQFSLMGARDLSVINTPPPNRHPVQTELHVFDDDIIKEAITFELSRGGQVYFVHNRVQSLGEMSAMLHRLVPDAKIGIGHGQMEGSEMEKVLMKFIDGEYDILLSTAIVESGLDIPNANTIIINSAQNFGLSDLHQLRGRVGRSNIKSFCYLFVPSFNVLTDEARKRLKAIEEFSAIGSGFNIAMRDLDIRGAGNILGAEQSGFISEMGYETYQKILNEAIEELKVNEFRHLYNEEDHRLETFVTDCTIETDLEILIPDSYVSNMTERLSLYKELDNLEEDEALEAYKSRLNDRFGEVPPQTLDLIKTVKLRVIAKKVGFEKLVLKQSRMICHFISNPENLYYQSETFNRVIQFAQANANRCQMRQNGEKLTLTFQNVKTIEDAIGVLEGI
ncbi:transcription-repair coupling factor [Bacteroidales bacterium OttesenSCG-928-C19]|nr:transcription-repair coupling factor [Bacteroidales bacterium OttesenSCG-928-C19]